MTNNNFNIRPAQPGEEGLVLEFIKRLAEYEKCADEVVADEAPCISLFLWSVPPRWSLPRRMAW